MISEKKNVKYSKEQKRKINKKLKSHLQTEYDIFPTETTNDRVN